MVNKVKARAMKATSGRNSEERLGMQTEYKPQDDIEAVEKKCLWYLHMQ